MTFLILDRERNVVGTVEVGGRRQALRAFQKTHGGLIQTTGSYIEVLIGADVGVGNLTAETAREAREHYGIEVEA